MLNFRSAEQKDYNEFNEMYKKAQYLGCSVTCKQDFKKDKYDEMVGGNIIITEKEDDKYFGYAVLYGIDEDTCKIGEMYVKEQGKGYGKELFAYVREAIKESGFSRIILMSFSIETDRVWEKLGFESVNFTDEYEMILD